MKKEPGEAHKLPVEGDSEVGALVRDAAVVASVGFRRDGPVPAALIPLAAGNGGGLNVPGAGTWRCLRGARRREGGECRRNRDKADQFRTDSQIDLLHQQLNAAEEKVVTLTTTLSP